MGSKEHIFKNYYGACYYRDPERTSCHRERGLPAVEWSDGDKSYWENHTYYRLDGFAVDYSRSKCHCLNGKQLFGKSHATD